MALQTALRINLYLQQSPLHFRAFYSLSIFVQTFDIKEALIFFNKLKLFEKVSSFFSLVVFSNSYTLPTPYVVFVIHFSDVCISIVGNPVVDDTVCHISNVSTLLVSLILKIRIKEVSKYMFWIWKSFVSQITLHWKDSRVCLLYILRWGHDKWTSPNNLFCGGLSLKVSPSYPIVFWWKLDLVTSGSYSFSSSMFFLYSLLLLLT